MADRIRPNVGVSESGASDYETFVAENQKKVNLMLNRFLRISILIGPLLMLAIRFGIFHSVTYTTCIIISLFVLALSCFHYVLIRRDRSAHYAAAVAFLTMDLLLILMNSAHIGIYITWFVVPLISLLYCDFRIYGFALVINYIMMTISLWIVSPYYAGLRIDYERAGQYFSGRMGGFTIEMVIMAVAGYGLCRISTSYYRDLIGKYYVLSENRQLMHMSMTDELTGLANRRAFFADTEIYKEQKTESDLVLFSVDLNELKEANDSRGHVAGDELLGATAGCLAAAIGAAGTAYRVGGDEFLALVRTTDPDGIASEIRQLSGAWHGTWSDRLALAVGYAAAGEHPDADIHDLAVLADQMMYEDKARYYSMPGVDRRKRRTPKAERD